MKAAFTMIELIFVIVVLGIITAVALPRFLSVGYNAHEANLIAFVRTLNRTTGEDLWGKSISEGKKGSIKNLAPVEDADFLSKYIDIPIEINRSSIDLTKCGTNEYKTVMVADPRITGGEYNISCKDGTPISAPYFRLKRLRDGKILVSRD